MKIKFQFLFVFIGISVLLSYCSLQIPNSSRTTFLLDDDWKFINEEVEDGSDPELDTDNWSTVEVPHDWAISGEFNKEIDAQKTMVVQDGERVPKLRTGRTGALPHIGTGWYRKKLDIPKAWKDKRIHIEFDGAMSHAEIYLNGEYIGEWPYGYASFGFDLTEDIIFGNENLLAVRLENKPLSSRWYPGAGIYRNVRLVITSPIYVKQWGTYLTTPGIDKGKGTINLKTTILNKSGNPENIELITEILSPKGNIITSNTKEAEVNNELIAEQILEVAEPELWSVSDPKLYTAITRIFKDGKEVDVYETVFGFRYFKFTNDDGFYLNGQKVPLQGVCLHHDLGPLGAAFNESSMRHRMKLLKEMGCNAIRTAHNPPDPGFLKLADEMGFLIVNEAFDEWKYPKMENGYNTLWDEWARKDMIAFIHRDRNHPSVIAWGIGNEIMEQRIEGGEEYCKFLVDICKQEDPTRPTTAALDNWQDAIKRGFGNIVDIPSWNYKPQYYQEIHDRFPHWKMMGIETASTVSSRGEYFFPVIERIHYTREPYHCSSFDMEFPRWASSPDTEWAAQDAAPFMAGEFVWTGFDYLGEPTPYNIEWPARSSYFGIIDLCGIPKDRFYLYQSRWSDKEVLHILPHWNWEEGQNITVHCYTNFDKAELFINGKSEGIAEKDPSNLYTTYRLVWEDLTYIPGEVKVVALDEDNKPVKEAVTKTAGPPAQIRLEPDRRVIAADGKELVFITVSVVDKDGVLCPRANNLINFTTEGEGVFKAVGNGDPTSLESFVKPFRKAFNGKCMVILASTENPGKILLKAESDGLSSTQVEIQSQ